MTIEPERLELLLEKLHDRMLDYGRWLFVCGFVVGLIVAWLIVVY
jgi:hypothetical protein